MEFKNQLCGSRGSMQAAAGTAYNQWFRLMHNKQDSFLWLASYVSLWLLLLIKRLFVSSVHHC